MNFQRKFLTALLSTVSTVALAQTPPAAPPAPPTELKIGIVSFLSGPGAAPFGVPARNTAEFLADAFNSGKAPAPYNVKGFGGLPIKLVVIDEAGSTTNVVTEYRNLVQREKVDLVIGYVSSGNCLAVAPVAEELKTLTMMYDCGSPRLFEESPKKYVFRAVNHATADGVAAALYLKAIKPNAKTYSGLNQNYAFGQDSWADFQGAVKMVSPNLEEKISQMPKLFAGQYSAEISALLESKSDLIHSSIWGGDMEAFILQAGLRGLFKQSTVLLTGGEVAMFRLNTKIPEGTVIGARGPYGVYAPKSALNDWYRSNVIDRYNAPPNLAAYQMAHTFMAAKLAFEKALAANGGNKPNSDQIADAMKGMTYEGPGGIHKFNLSNGHQATAEMVYGRVKHVNGQIQLVDQKRFTAEQVMPPDGVKAADWMASAVKK
jgi:branched-chain amino acid transport system substrate-binding protein